ncbi:hypothetical protein [Mucilaginibacter endophyticus]|nr:hypothetical protein [Mucilaginibacter endophyticus]
MTRLCINSENDSTENGNQPPGTRGNANYREDQLGGTTNLSPEQLQSEAA